MKRWLPLALIFFLLATNRWPGWDGGIELLSAADVKETYLPVAMAAPGFPRESMAPHQAQRFVLPFVVGWLSKIISMPVPLVFWLFVFCMQALLLWLFWRSAGKNGAGPNRRILAFSLLVLQPYFLRYYWLVPGMAADVLFELGTMVLAASLLSGRMLGIAVAALGRQTTLMLLPGTFIYLWRGEAWKAARFGKKAYSAGWAMLAFGATFYFTGRIGARFSEGATPPSTMYGIFPWLLSGGSAAMFAEHTLRCLLPLLPVLTLLALESPRSWKAGTWAFFLMGVAVASQPFLAGPLLTGQNAARLSTLALLPLTLAWAGASRREWSEKGFAAVLVLLILGSFHHLYTSLGPPGPSFTAGLQLVVAIGVFAIGFSEARLKS